MSLKAFEFAKVEDGCLQYSFEIVGADKSITEVEIDAGDGKVLDTDKEEATRWQQARDEIRSGSNVEGPFSALKRVTDTVLTVVDVSPLERVVAGQEDISLAEAHPKAA